MVHTPFNVPFYFVRSMIVVVNVCTNFYPLSKKIAEWWAHNTTPFLFHFVFPRTWATKRATGSKEEMMVRFGRICNELEEISHGRRLSDGNERKIVNWIMIKCLITSYSWFSTTLMILMIFGARPCDETDPCRDIVPDVTDPWRQFTYVMLFFGMMVALDRLAILLVSVQLEWQFHTSTWQAQIHRELNVYPNRDRIVPKFVLTKLVIDFFYRFGVEPIAVNDEINIGHRQKLFWQFKTAQF